MAKKIKKEKTEKYKLEYPSRYGSHASMIDEAATADMNDPNKVVCKAELGLYITERNRLDNGLADPNRYTTANLINP